MPFLLALILITIGLIVFWLGRRSQVEAGLPIGRVIYSDTQRLAIAGKAVVFAQLIGWPASPIIWCSKVVRSFRSK